MVDADGVSEMPQDYMCHSNLDYDPVKHQEIFGARNLTSRLFTLSQGQLEIDFPDGTGANGTGGTISPQPRMSGFPTLLTATAPRGFSLDPHQGA
jgi:hypothetical protein